jgi:hypothetical protein
VKTAEKKDLDEKKLYESLQIQLFQKGDMKPKELQKLQNKVYKADKSSKKAEADLKLATVKQKQVWSKYYDGLRDIMKQLEDLDRKRVEFSKNILDKYCNFETENSDLYLKESNNMEDVYKKISVEDDIQNFIKQNCSGKQRPPTEQYEEYKISIPSEMKVTFNTNNTLQQAKMLLKKKGISFDENAVDTSGTYGTNKTLENKTMSFIKKDDSKSNNTRKVIKTVKVLYEYAKKSDEEINLNPNDVVNVYEVTDDGWWVGECNGATGIFPSNFTDAENEESKVTEVTEEVSEKKTANNNGKEFAVAIYDYDTSEEGELNMKEGDLIEIVSKGDDGWWTGVLNGAKGTFPSNYTQIKE